MQHSRYGFLSATASWSVATAHCFGRRLPPSHRDQLAPLELSQAAAAQPQPHSRDGFLLMTATWPNTAAHCYSSGQLPPHCDQLAPLEFSQNAVAQPQQHPHHVYCPAIHLGARPARGYFDHPLRTQRGRRASGVVGSGPCPPPPARRARSTIAAILPWPGPRAAAAAPSAGLLLQGPSPQGRFTQLGYSRPRRAH